MCVRKLASRMVITITNSNSTPEVNSSEVSLKLQWEFCVCTQKHSNHLWEARLMWVTLGLLPYVFIHKLIPLENLHSKDELQSSLQWSLKLRPIILKKNCNHHYNDDSSYKFSLVCNRSISIVYDATNSWNFLILEMCFFYPGKSQKFLKIPEFREKWKIIC